MQKILKFSGLAGILSVVGVGAHLYLSHAAAPGSELAKLDFGATAYAQSGASDSCFTAFDAIRAAKPAKGTYADAVLDHLHEELYRFNSLATADVELIFCRLVTVMDFNPDLTALPQTLSKTDPMGATISVNVTAPTETFATTLGYTAKAEFKNDDTTFMTLWWSGSGSASKGYLIQGKNPMQKDGNTRLRYLQWDRTSTTQIVKVMGTQFATGFLSSAAAGAESKTGGDQALFARLSYDTSSKAVTAQAVEIRQNTGANFACVRTYFNGTLGGTIDAFRPAKGTPEAVTETSTGGCPASGCVTTPGAVGGLDGETNVVDATTTADHSGTPSPGSDVASGTFDYSCNDVNSAGAASKPFANNTVDYTVSPSTIFPK